MGYIPQAVSQRIPLVQAPPLRQEQGCKNMKITCSIYGVPMKQVIHRSTCVFQIVPTHSFMKSSAETNYNEFNVQS
jgi:hypothetical protein